jgi:predicted membrane-bound spermidine synthase
MGRLGYPLNECFDMNFQIAPTRQLKQALAFAGIGFLMPVLLALTGVQNSPLDTFLGGMQEGYAYNTWMSVLAYVGVLFPLIGLTGMQRSRLVMMSLGLALIAYVFYLRHLPIGPSILAVSAGAALGVAVLIEILINRRLREDAENQFRLKMGMAVVLVICGFSVAALAGLNMAYLLQPRLWDVVALAFDQTLGFPVVSVVIGIAQGSVWIKGLLEVVYGLLPLGFVAVFGLNLKRGDAGRVNVLLTMFLSGCAAWVAFHLVPVAGPIHVFGDDIGNKLLEPVANALPVVAPGVYWRNGVPSMHFGWAIAIAWLAYVDHHPRLFRAAVGFAGLTVLATFGLGEHYLVDLLVSIPFMLWLFALFATGLGTSPLRKRAFVVGLFVYLGWVVVLRWGAPVWQGQALLAWAWVLVTLAACLPLHLQLTRALRQTEPRAHEPVVPVAQSATDQASDPARHLRWVTAMFVLSGMAGLMYEVLFSKILATIFGSTALAAYTVLGTYMGGMALGTWLGGRLSGRVRQPLVAYAICEVLIAAFFVLTPALKAPIMSLYVSLAQGLPPDAPALLPMRLALGSLLLLLPTVAMGATLPLLVKDLSVRHQGIGVSVGRLYAANTIGAAAGAILAGYVLIPSLGLTQGTLVAALANMLVALIAMDLHKRSVPVVLHPSRAAKLGASDLLSKLPALPWTWVPWVLLAVGGVVTLALEIVYFHMLATVAGNSTYAFALMLAAFLVGLGVGGEAARRWIRAGRDLIGGIVGAEWALAMLVMAGTAVWGGLPDYFAAFAYHRLPEGFGPREVVRAAVCVLAMLPPAACIGFIYPLAMEWITRSKTEGAVATMGTASALNTFGNIAGVFLAAFVLLPWLGSLWSIKALALVSLLLALLAGVVWVVGQTINLQKASLLVAGVGLFAATSVVTPMQWDYTALSTGSNVYFRSQPWGRAIDHLESVDGGMTTVTEGQGADGQAHRTLLTNGKFQGSDSWGGEMVAQIGIALTPLLHTPQRGDALVIGYGSGVTARALLDVGFKQVNIAELSRDIVDMADKHFSRVNAMASQNPRSKLYVTDGRNLLLLSPKTYDLVSIEISSIWFAGAASLYNVEFYDLLKKRLNPGGVLQQWIQVHHISPLDLLTVIGSVRAQFPYVWFYMVGGQGVIVASEENQPPLKQNALVIDSAAGMKQLLAVYGGSVAGLGKDLLLGPEQVNALLNSVPGVPMSYWVSTDATAKLEYSTPRGNVLEGPDVVPNNIRFLTSQGRASLGW